VVIQAGESTNFTKKSYVAAFVRFLNGEIQENFSRCKNLPEISERYKVYLMFFSSYLETEGLSW
jgi:hypothetical protein